MGMILKQVYDLVTVKSGFKGRMRLAVMTGIPSTRALEIPDDPEALARFKRASYEILHEDITPLLGAKF
jgi:hypothetical protein